MTSSPAVRYHKVALEGGLDLVTPTLEAPAGVLRDCLNFEVSPVKGGGYSRIGGYERYDGRPSPSAATYVIVQIASFTNTPTLGQTLTGFTSGATGVIIAIGSVYMALTKIAVSTFTTSEVVKVGAVVIGTAVVQTEVISPLTNAQYLGLAAEQYRPDIAVVAGSGAILGVVAATFVNVEHVYAFRNNAGGTASILFVDSGSGWTVVTLFSEINFTGCAATPIDGSTLTQGANSATIKRVVLESGSYTAGPPDAAGRFIITTPAPGNFAAGAATANGAACTLTAIQTVITLNPGGTYEFVINNFQGQAGTVRIYGCDGKNRGFEFDGTIYVPITTNAASPSTDKPVHVTVNHQHLFWGFESSIVHSAPGLPYNYTGIANASEIALGDYITNFLIQAGSSTGAALAITTRSNTFLLYGKSTASWDLTPMNVGTGGLARTGQLLNYSYWFDAPGIVNMYTTQNFGNFAQASITTKIQPLIEQQRTKVTTSVVNRAKNQYRVLFSDSTALYVTVVDGKVYGIGKILYSHAMSCAWSSVQANGTERVFYGSTTTGYVYQVDKGSSFDGEAINAFIKLNWDGFGSPRMRKRLRRLLIELQGSSFATITYGYSFSYLSTDVKQPPSIAYSSAFTGLAVWDAFTWDQFTWDGTSLLPTEVLLEGTTETIQSIIGSTTNYIYPYTVNSLLYHYSDRRGVR